MRAFSVAVSLLLLAVVIDAQVQMTGKHNQKIADDLNLYNNDDHIIELDVSAPDVVINKYHHVSGQNVKDKLRNFVEEASKEFADKLKHDKPGAEALVVNMPSVNGTKTTKGPFGKRSIEEQDQIDVEGTQALYKQTLEFLDKYDVELRFD